MALTQAELNQRCREKKRRIGLTEFRVYVTDLEKLKVENYVKRLIAKRKLR